MLVILLQQNINYNFLTATFNYYCFRCRITNRCFKQYSKSINYHAVEIYKKDLYKIL